MTDLKKILKVVGMDIITILLGIYIIFFADPQTYDLIHSGLTIYWWLIVGFIILFISLFVFFLSMRDFAIYKASENTQFFKYPNITIFLLSSNIAIMYILGDTKLSILMALSFGTVIYIARLINKK